jgi:LysR family nitrogen assimilation transcriptional regulator
MQQEKLYLVGARPAVPGSRMVGAPVSLAQVAKTELVIPARPHSIRMLLESALADAGLKARVALVIESVPTMLDLVQHDGCHAVLTLNAIQRSGSKDSFQARPVGQLSVTLRLATSSQRPRGALMDAAIELVRELVAEHWA